MNDAQAAAPTAEARTVPDVWRQREAVRLGRHRMGADEMHNLRWDRSEVSARQPGRQGPSSDPNRSPGAYCSPAGATGTTADGTPTACTARPGDDRARWRQP